MNYNPYTLNYNYQYLNDSLLDYLEILKWNPNSTLCVEILGVKPGSKSGNNRVIIYSPRSEHMMVAYKGLIEND